MLSEAEIEGVVDGIVQLVRPERVVLFGSYAKGTATPASDLDLLVVLDTALPPAKRTSRVAPAVEGRLVRVDVHVYTPEEVEEGRRVPYSFLHTVLRSGRTVYAQEVRA